MQLFLKQKVFSIKSKSSVFDAAGNEVYYIEGKVISVGKKLTIYNTNMEELAFIRQKVPALMPKYFVEINGEQVALIKKKFSLFKPKYEIEGKDWQIEGDFFAHDYSINSPGGVIVTIHKKWMSWGDAYEIDIVDGEDVITVLATVLAIDAVLDSQESSSSSISFSSNS